MTTEAYVLKRIEMMEQELERLKKAFLKKGKGEVISLRGIWEGVDVSDAEIEEAKRSLFKEASENEG